MPRACPVESHGVAFMSNVRTQTGLNVSLHGASPWHPVTSVLLHLAASMNLHGSSPWHHVLSPRSKQFALSSLCVVHYVSANGAISPGLRSILLTSPRCISSYA